MAKTLQCSVEPVADLPQGFKMTQLGPLPENWEVVKLEDIFEIQQGKALSPRHRSRKSPYPFLRTANVFWGKLDLSVLDEMDFTDEEVRRLKLLPGDLLVCEGGDIGRTAIWRGELQLCCYQNHLHRLRAKNKEIEPEFYMYWMQAAILLFGLYIGQGNKTTIPNLSKARLAGFDVPLPPLSEQRTIARVLRSVQLAKEATERVIQAIRELKKSLMHHLFTYGSVSVEEAARVPLKETEIGLLPEHWDVMRLGEITRLSRSTLNPQSFSDEVFDYYSIPAYQTLGYAAIEKGSAIRSAKIIIESGTILFGKLNPRVPKVWRVLPSERRKIASTEFIPMHPIYEKCTSDFLYYLCWSDYVLPRSQELVSGSTPSRQRVDINAFLSIKVPVPPLCEQHKITYILKLVDKKLRTEEARKQALEVLFKTLLHNLMTGKVRVTDLALAGTGEVV